jgi:hypothetical protein
MSITATDTTQRLDIGAMLQELLSAIGRNIGSFGLLGLVLVGAPSALLAVGRALGEANFGFALLGFLGFLATVVARPIFYGAVIHGTLRQLDGDPASMAECLKAGRRRWGTMLGLMISTGLLVGLGLVFLIVPGVILALRWAVAGPVVVTGGRGSSDAMGRSAKLTEGRRWSMFLFYLVILLTLVCAAAAIVAVGAGVAAVTSDVVTAVVVSPLYNICMEVVLAAASAVLFRRLRSDKEGLADDTLAEVFA